MKTKLLLVITTLISSFTTTFAQIDIIDTLFNPTDIGFGNGDGVNYIVTTTSIQSDGKIIIGGRFYSYNGTERNRIARLNTNGSLDTSFNPGTGANVDVVSTSIQSDGKIIMGGYFTSYNGTGRNRIARLNSDGSLDTLFNPGTGANDIVNSISIQSDGKIIIGGNFTSYNGTVRNRVARLNTDGSLDASFNTGTGGNDNVNSSSIQSDGKIIIGGNFTSYNGSSRNRVARLNTDGSLDTSFNTGTGADKRISSTAIQSDGKIIIGGNFTSYNGTSKLLFARLNTDGSLDTSFNLVDLVSFGNNYVTLTSIQSDGKIIIGGDFSFINTINQIHIARLNTDGSLDASFNPLTENGSTVIAYSISIQNDGKIIFGDLFSPNNGQGGYRIVRFNTDGSLDNLFNPGTGANYWINSTSLQSDSKIIIGGSFNSFNATYRSSIARLNTNGSLDTSFNPGRGPDGPIKTISIQYNGKLIIGGQFIYWGYKRKNNIARLNSDGSLDTLFNSGTGANIDVVSTSIQSDEKIIIGGGFTSYNGTGRNRIARLNTDGSLDASFNVGTGANNAVISTSIQSDGKIIIGGYFTSYNGTGRNRIARLNSDGSLDTLFNPGTGANDIVNSISIQSDGKIIIGGNFTSYNGTGRNRIARLNTDGSVDASFNTGPGANDNVNSTSIQSDGKIIIGGNFTSYNGIGRNMIARLNTNGSLDPYFNYGTGANSWINSTSIQSDGKIIIGGYFTSYNGTGRNRIARIFNCYPASGTDVQTACNSYTWIDGNTYTTSNNTATYNIVGGAANGCDSLVMLNLTINNVDASATSSGDSLTANATGATYQWLDCNNNFAIISGATSRTYIPSSTGNYAVAVKQTVCTDTSSCFNVTVTEILSLTENDKVFFYPNPFSSYTVLHCEKVLHNAILKVENTFGQTVTEIKNIQGQTVVLQRNNLPTGLYFVRLSEDNKQIILKKIMIVD